MKSDFTKEENAFEETSASTPADSEKKSGFNLYIVIISGIAVLAAAIVFIVLKMKKK
jgi:flagellar basal body-associated protein FliL